MQRESRYGVAPAFSCGRACTTYLPRKFKVAVAASGDTSVDISTNDLGIVPVLGDADVFLMHLGGTTNSVRRNRVYRELVPLGDLLATLDPVLTAFASDRRAGETLGDFCERVVLFETSGVPA